jgi:hypothetical protein
VSSRFRKHGVREALGRKRKQWSQVEARQKQLQILVGAVFLLRAALAVEFLSSS